MFLEDYQLTLQISAGLSRKATYLWSAPIPSSVFSEDYSVVAYICFKNRITPTQSEIRLSKWVNAYDEMEVSITIGNRFYGLNIIPKDKEDLRKDLMRIVMRALKDSEIDHKRTKREILKQFGESVVEEALEEISGS